MNKFSNKYDLEGRTAKLGEKIISLCKTIKQDLVNRPIISQLVRSATSIGANYAEANGARFKQDFHNKIYLCRKEAQETRYWLRILLHSEPQLKPHTVGLQDECRQLILNFQKKSVRLFLLNPLN